MEVDMVEQLLTVIELATALKVHKSWIYSKTRETGAGGIPKIQVGKYLRFRESEVLEWLQSKQDQDK